MLYDGHLIAERWLRKAKRIIVYGVAFNSYDSELLSILPIDGERNLLQELVIVNPDPNAREIVAMSFGVYDFEKRTDIDPVTKRKIKLNFL